MSFMDEYTWAPTDTAGDCRRATALMLHHLDTNEEGAGAVLAEAEQAGRLVPLVLALLDQTLHIAPALNSEQGRALLHRAAARLAYLEEA